MAASTRRREAAQKRDTELHASATALLDDVEASTRLAALLGHAPTLMRFSIRNQLLLQTQADEAGIALSDVATYKQWRQVGRQVRKGETGMWIIRPSSRKSEAKDGDASTGRDEQAEDAGRNEETGKPVGFRGMVVFDISQTDDVFDDADQVTVDPETGERSVRVGPVVLSEADANDAKVAREARPTGPAALLGGLRDAAEAAGYDVSTGDVAEIDVDARLLTLPGELTPDTIAPVIDAARRLAASQSKTRKAARTPSAAEDTEEITVL
ncbi:ArdC family protein [Actinomadura meridiana]